MNEKLEYILNMYPNAKCELEYTDAFSLLIAIMLSARTTDAKVNKITKVLFSKYQTIKDLAFANREDIETILKPLGMAKTKSQNIIEIASIIHDKYHDIVPSDKDKLLELPGVGNKTSLLFQAEYLKIPSIPVDTHVNRVSKRLGFASLNDNVEMVREKLEKQIPQEKWIQMHHSMIFFGRYFCKSINPCCKKCKLQNECLKDNY